VQPYNDPANPQYKYKLIAGFRRHMAFKTLGAEKIPAFIVEGLSEEASREYNIVENVNRKDLNPVQEANALKYYFDLGYTDEMLALKFNKTIPWAASRRIINTLEDDIKLVIAAGIIKTYSQIIALKRMTKDQRYETVRNIKDGTFKTEQLGVKLRGEKRKIHHKVLSRLSKAQPPTLGQMDRIKNAIFDGPGPGMMTRLIAYCQGYISEITVWKDLIEWCDQQGYSIDHPDDVRIALGMEFRPVPEEAVAA
jgi:ParB/RepB/Spo0J family partition protein